MKEPRRESVTVQSLRFVGEQDGVPERELKRRLCDLFDEQQIIGRAYLARAIYDTADETNVVLCLTVVRGEFESLNAAIGHVFHGMFRSTEHLDVILLTEDQEAQLAPVVEPFYSA